MSAEAVIVEGLEVAHGPTQAVRSLSFAARRGELMTLLGPSGCGKTTSLRAIAGLETPSAGRVVLEGRVAFDQAAGIDLAPERRGLSMVFQSYAIWPHMTVFENVAFGLRARRAKRDEIAASVRRGLEAVGLHPLADRPATRLSGGQQQRVALARAIACNSSVILLDEPLSNLDAMLRMEMRAEFKALQHRLGFTAIYVTHDQEEALVLADRVLVMRNGLVEQTGRPAEIHDRPRTRFVADFVGVRNVFPCEVKQDGGRFVAILDNGVRLQLRGEPAKVPSCVCFRPISVSLSPRPDAQAMAATLIRATYLGDLMEYELRAGGLTIWARSLARGDLAEGAQVFWSVPPDACFLVTA